MKHVDLLSIDAFRNFLHQLNFGHNKNMKIQL